MTERDRLADTLEQATRDKLDELEAAEQAAIAANDTDTASQRRGERLLLVKALEGLRAQRARHRVVMEAAAKHGGPLIGQGITLKDAALKALELRGSDGRWPNQEDLAEALHVSERQLRKLGKYEYLKVYAEALARE